MSTIKLNTLDACEQLSGSLKMALALHIAVRKEYAGCPELIKSISRLIAREQERLEAEILLEDVKEREVKIG